MDENLSWQEHSKLTENKIGNEKINDKFDISRFIYSKRRFDCFLQSLSSCHLKCLQFRIFYIDFNKLYVIKQNKRYLSTVK